MAANSTAADRNAATSEAQTKTALQAEAASKANLEQAQANLLNAVTDQEALQLIDEYRDAITVVRKQRENAKPSRGDGPNVRPVPGNVPAILRQHISETNAFATALENQKRNSSASRQDEQANALLDLVESHRARVATIVASQPTSHQEGAGRTLPISPDLQERQIEVERLKANLARANPTEQREAIDAFHQIAEQKRQSSTELSERVIHTAGKLGQGTQALPILPPSSVPLLTPNQQ